MTNHAPDRPLVTFALFAYNQENYIREAVEGAFSQTYEPMEIILSDDCSSDRTFELMQQLANNYRGPHKVLIQQNKNNLGISNHFNKVLERCQGDFLVLAAGDDISHPERVDVAINCFNRFREAVVFESLTLDFSSDVNAINSTTSPRGGAIVSFTLSDMIAGASPSPIAAARIFRVSPLRNFPLLKGDCPSEDTPTMLRSLLYGNGLYYDQPLIYRRVHDKSLSKTGFLSPDPLLKIRDQQILDIEFAYSRSWINGQTKKLLISWAQNVTTRRVAARIRNSHSSLLYSAISFIFMQDISLQQKMKYFLRLMTVKWRKKREA